MHVVQKKREKAQAAFEIRLDAKELAPYRQEALKNLAKNLQIEGFRPGHIPDSLAEQRLGEARILEETAQLAVQDTWGKLVKERNLDVLGEPRVEVLKLAPGNPLEFRITVTVLPEAELPDYKKIASEVSRRQVEVQEQEVQDALSWLQKSTDDFAKVMGNFENLESLKQSIQEGLRHEKELRETERLRQEIVENVALKTKIEIPTLLVEREKRVLFEGVKREEYVQGMGKTEQEVLDSFTKQAEERVKRFLVVRAVAQKEHIVPLPEEVEKEANKILQHYKNTKKAEKDIDPGRLREYVEGVMRHEKTLQFLESLAV